MILKARIPLHRALGLSRDQYTVHGLDCGATPRDFLKRIGEHEPASPLLRILSEEPMGVIMIMGGRVLDQGREFREQVECEESTEYEVLITPLLEGG